VYIELKVAYELLVRITIPRYFRHCSLTICINNRARCQVSTRRTENERSLKGKGTDGNGNLTCRWTVTFCPTISIEINPIQPRPIDRPARSTCSPAARHGRCRARSRSSSRLAVAAGCQLWQLAARANTAGGLSSWYVLAVIASGRRPPTRR
jgi:hypothetical protein